MAGFFLLDFFKETCYNEIIMMAPAILNRPNDGARRGKARARKNHLEEMKKVNGVIKLEEKRAPFETMPVDELRVELEKMREEKKDLYHELKPLLDRWNALNENVKIGEEVYRERVKGEAIREGKVVVIPKQCKNPVRYRERKDKLDPLMEDMIAAVGRGDFAEVARLQAEILAVK